MAAPVRCQQNPFSTAVKKVLDSWTALQLAVEHGFGGAESREKANWMVLAIDTWFKENEGIEPYEVEDFLTDILNDEFDLRVEDNSLQEISRLICMYYRLCQENKVDEIAERLNTLPKASTKDSQDAGDRVENMDSDEDTPAPSSSSHSAHTSSGAATAHRATAHETGEDMETTQDAPDEEEEDGWRVMRHGRKKR